MCQTSREIFSPVSITSKEVVATTKEHKKNTIRGCIVVDQTQIYVKLKSTTHV